jgi:starch phosphorylase
MHIREDMKGYDSLEELALNLIWSWNPNANKIWESLDPDLWRLTHNPWIILQTVSNEKLKEFLANPAFCKIVEDLLHIDGLNSPSPTWFQKNHASVPLKCVAYFSMEYMLSEALPIYSGGLGNVAGDQLKAASELGVPVVAIGLLYQQGYFRQIIDQYGAQQALFPYNNPLELPVRPLRKTNGEWLRIEIALPGWSLWLRAWEVRVGGIRLYLLDSNDAVNYPPHRAITSELYGGDKELRLKQELILGIGGWRLLHILGIHPDVCHLNEGHAAFAILERAYCYMTETGSTFKVALAATRAGNLFTTHTAVPAGFDRFDSNLVEKYLTKYAVEKLGTPIEDILALGRLNPKDENESFNMAYLAIRGSGAVNGVSQLHGKVSRHIFNSLFPRWPTPEVPVGHVTNGVHIPSWVSSHAAELWDEFSGEYRCPESGKTIQRDFKKTPDAVIWKMRNDARKTMIEYGRLRLPRILEARGEPPEEVEAAKHLFDPATLTLGFARRFATYKRPNMLLHDPERFVRILTNPERPIQLVIAGKAHPADLAGQKMIQEWMHFMWRPEVRPHVVFISDYDMLITARLVRGVDLWINTPRRPWEACGTSGMKVLANGGLNLSELDGWWAEAYCPEVGWALGDGKEHGDDPAWDAFEAEQLYNLLENEVIPAFYERDADGVPTAWIAKVKESMARLTPQFCATRAVGDYVQKYYLPCAENYAKRAANEGALAQQITHWKSAIEEHWPKIQFGLIRAEAKKAHHFFEVQVLLRDLGVDKVKVELYADGSPPEIQEMKPISEREGLHTYRATFATSRPLKDYTPRVVPYFPSVVVPLETDQILWAH